MPEQLLMSGASVSPDPLIQGGKNWIRRIDSYTIAGTLIPAASTYYPVAMFSMENWAGIGFMLQNDLGATVVGKLYGSILGTETTHLRLAALASESVNSGDDEVVIGARDTALENTTVFRMCTPYVLAALQTAATPPTSGTVQLHVIRFAPVGFK